MTGATGSPASEAPSLRFAGYQDGVIPLGAFTTLVVERVNQPGVLTTPNVWQDNALSGSRRWSGKPPTAGMAFCLNEGLSPVCTFAEFQGGVPTWGDSPRVQVAIGTGVPAVTSFADGVSVTTDDGRDGE